MNFFNSINIILILLNVFIFIFVQTILWYFEISRLNVKMLKRIINSIKYSIPEDLKNSIKTKELEKLKKNNKNEKYFKNLLKNRDKENRKLLITYVGYILLILLIIIIILLIINKINNNKWKSYHFKSLFYILFAYLSEIVIYFLVINRYQIINISKVVRQLNSKLIDNPLCYFFYQNKTKEEIRDKVIKLYREIYSSFSNPDTFNFTLWHKKKEIIQKHPKYKLLKMYRHIYYDEYNYYQPPKNLIKNFKE